MVDGHPERQRATPFESGAPLAASVCKWYPGNVCMGVHSIAMRTCLSQACRYGSLCCRCGALSLERCSLGLGLARCMLC